MTSWDHIEDFAERFTLKDAVANPEVISLFAPIAEFCDALIIVEIELERNPDQLWGATELAARDNLNKAAQDLVEALVAAVSGMYSTAALAFRSSIEATFRSLMVDDVVRSKLPQWRQQELLRRKFQPSMNDYRVSLETDPQLRFNAGRLYTVYNLLSMLAHWKIRKFGGLQQYLFSIPGFDESDARDLSLIMREGCSAGGQLIRERFKEVLRSINIRRATALDDAIARLAEIPEHETATLRKLLSTPK